MATTIISEHIVLYVLFISLCYRTDTSRTRDLWWEGGFGGCVGWLVSKMRVWNVLLWLAGPLFGLIRNGAACVRDQGKGPGDGWMEMTVGKSTENLKIKKKEGATRKKGKDGRWIWRDRLGKWRTVQGHEPFRELSWGTGAIFELCLKK